MLLVTYRSEAERPLTAEHSCGVKCYSFILSISLMKLKIKLVLLPRAMEGNVFTSIPTGTDT